MSIFLRGPGLTAAATGAIRQGKPVLGTDYATDSTNFGCYDSDMVVHELRALLTHTSMNGKIVTITIQAQAGYEEREREDERDGV